METAVTYLRSMPFGPWCVAHPRLAIPWRSSIWMVAAGRAPFETVPCGSLRAVGQQLPKPLPAGRKVLFYSIFIDEQPSRGNRRV